MSQRQGEAKGTERFASALARARQAADLTLDGAAEASGVGRRTIARYELAQGNPTLSNLLALCVAYETSLESLCSEAGV